MSLVGPATGAARRRSPTSTTSCWRACGPPGHHRAVAGRGPRQARLRLVPPARSLLRRELVAAPRLGDLLDTVPAVVGRAFGRASARRAAVGQRAHAVAPMRGCRGQLASRDERPPRARRRGRRPRHVVRRGAEHVRAARPARLVGVPHPCRRRLPGVGRVPRTGTRSDLQPSSRGAHPPLPAGPGALAGSSGTSSSSPTAGSPHAGAGAADPPRRPVDVLQACNPPDTYWLLARLLRRAGTRASCSTTMTCAPSSTARGAAGVSLVVLRASDALERATYGRPTRSSAPTSPTAASPARARVERPADVTIVRSGPDPERMHRATPCPRCCAATEHLVCYLGIMGPQDGVDAGRAGRRRSPSTSSVARDIRFALLGYGDCLRRPAASCRGARRRPITSTSPGGSICAQITRLDVHRRPRPVARSLDAVQRCVDDEQDAGVPRLRAASRRLRAHRDGGVGGRGGGVRPDHRGRRRRRARLRRRPSSSWSTTRPAGRRWAAPAGERIEASPRLARLGARPTSTSTRAPGRPARRTRPPPTATDLATREGAWASTST